MTKQEYRELVKRCQKALEDTANSCASSDARNGAINFIRLKFELARELYKLDNEPNQVSIFDK